MSQSKALQSLVSASAALVLSLLIATLLMGPAMAVSIRDDAHDVVTTQCFEATINTTPTSSITTENTDISSGNSTLIAWADGDRLYFPADAEGGLLVEQTGVASWQWTGKGTTRLQVEYRLNFRNDAVNSIEYQRIFVGYGTQCPGSGLQSGDGMSWAAHYTNSRSALGTAIFEVSENDCFGILVETKDSTIGDAGAIAVLTRESISVSVRQISTADNICRGSVRQTS